MFAVVQKHVQNRRFASGSIRVCSSLFAWVGVLLVYTYRTSKSGRMRATPTTLTTVVHAGHNYAAPGGKVYGTLLIWVVCQLEASSCRRVLELAHGTHVLEQLNMFILARELGLVLICAS